MFGLTMKNMGKNQIESKLIKSLRIVILFRNIVST